MIRFDEVSVRYPGRDRDVLAGVDLTIPEGDMCLVVGGTGTGKSTLLGTINGLVPRFTGGSLTGRVTVDGRSTGDHPLREFADVVGYVPQNPVRSFVAATVEDELAYGMEQLGVPPHVMRKRVEETLDLLGLDPLRSRHLETLSGGEQQRVAIGAALAAGPRVLVLDEPTSALDPLGAEEVLASLLRLVHDLGVTVVVSEHRLERIIEYADSVVVVDGSGNASMGAPAEMMESSPVAPPVVELGRALNWHPLPLSVRDGRRMAAGITLPTRDGSRAQFEGSGAGIGRGNGWGGAGSRPIVRAEGVTVRYGGKVALDHVDVDLHRGSVTALMGRNGSGKSSLLWALGGRRDAGRVTIAGHDPGELDPVPRRALVGLVPQDPSDLLFAQTVAEECRLADGGTEARCQQILDILSPGIDQEHDPLDLSEGQRLALAIAIQVTDGPRVLLLDEPTRGLDYASKERLGRILTDLSAHAAVMVATHDVEFVAAVADRVVILAQGEIVADGSTGEIVTSSAVFAPQIAKITGAHLTVADALGGRRMETPWPRMETP